MKRTIWDVLSVLLILGTCCAGSYILGVYAYPNSALNPFPPATLPPTILISTATKALVIFPATWTPTPSPTFFTSTPTIVPTPTETQTLYVVPSATNTPTPTNTPTATGNPESALYIRDSSVTRPASGTIDCTLEVILSPTSAQKVKVHYHTAADSAVANTDFQPVDGTLTFEANDNEKDITVKVNGNTTTTTVKDFFVRLSDASGASIADGQGICTINPK